MSSITKIKAREILDSRGDPTLEVDTTVDNNFFGRFSVPSGASKGKYEALEKRDGDRAHFEGKGVKKLAERLEQEIAPNILNKDFNQNSIDHFLIETDATTNKSNLGANLILGVSMSFAKAESSKLNIPFYKYIASLVGNTSLTLPIPMVNIINGGMHADSGLDIQEFMIVPLLAKSFTESLENCTKVFWHLKSILKENNLSIAVGDEGGFAPKLGSHNKALDFMMQAIEKAGFKAGFDFGVALDCAASEFYNPSADGNKYLLKSEDGEMNSDELSNYYENLIKNYPIISIEDPFAEDDFQASASFVKNWGDKLMVVGDDLFVTNIKRLEEGIKQKSANSILIKLNQIGTLSETLGVISRAKEVGWKTIVSHRSGETEDTSIAHLAVGTGSGYVKTGSVSRGERTAKYNELLRIEEEITSDYTKV
ncbi:MAG: phosphopyruvate hydratase [Candidatus Zambryskibacteria bacterium RIFCSPLOWO2_01_FULL_39_39]|nr:MAG: Enolase [Parcubacteria group bacterium GW2011_GWA1_38_7]OHA87269.1 MAG: phosphopyruvate hydratase [Candidatus Zambryskibacteria bacterium RIFCSPHIGHO2_01_FULL_39_63]OHA95206.1 MAG: phosphopyruvate hydratase [Candidatus Zambryskibacteria bacterium RIFCSPHIGHO2_02_FULL_39_19]OHA98738.1 MAG: phosphopyruvate hydratase [Candidatus Zambryskibacteria bacterium RIFCSPHIGHO2_12_FULL_39_21]OHB02258.1 MAG: phosphopyruvate hydratase [Candidatus Zambryskibacteria bacterium RIFCSPLOWO2_01_FULL_39_39]